MLQNDAPLCYCYPSSTDLLKPHQNVCTGVMKMPVIPFQKCHWSKKVSTLYHSTGSESVSVHKPTLTAASQHSTLPNLKFSSVPGPMPCHVATHFQTMPKCWSGVHDISDQHNMKQPSECFYTFGLYVKCCRSIEPK